ncbi:MAG: Transcriptional regulator, MarR family, partial [uncultured Quadrisphaera sp.]
GGRGDDPVAGRAGAGRVARVPRGHADAVGAPRARAGRRRPLDARVRAARAPVGGTRLAAADVGPGRRPGELAQPADPHDRPDGGARPGRAPRVPQRQARGARRDDRGGVPGARRRRPHPRDRCPRAPVRPPHRRAGRLPRRRHGPGRPAPARGL